MKESIAKSPSGRVARTPIASRNVLTVRGKKEGFEYRIVNDTADRIQAFQEAGYELVDASEVSIGDKRINNASPEGSKAQLSVGKGDKAFLMRQRKDFYEEDQAAKAAKVSQLENTMKSDVVNAGGRFEIERSTKF